MSDSSIAHRLGVQPLHLDPGTAEPATDTTGRYRTIGEIARGGVGVVYKGRDIDLGREVALKVLRDEHSEDSSARARFMEEAQVGGQLQHPGIVPVYELALDAEDRPYFTMKLVKGKTLAAHMKEGSLGPRRLLGIFEKICETMAYAHARGVIHRDLKPANIMVGAFGEVQVVDWGFAKVLREGGIADEKAKPDVSVIATVRSGSGSEGSQSVAGSVMGTPAYMPPEQALGQIEAVDETSDVFALGAILFQILTGEKLYEQVGSDSLLVLAAQCRIDERFELLREHDLESLVRACLQAEQSERPTNAGEVERIVSAHLASVEERAQAARIAAAEAKVHARAERQKRALTFALGAAVLMGIVSGAGGWWWLDQLEQQRAEQRTRTAQAAIDESILLRGQGRIRDAVAAANRAIEVEDSNDARATLSIALARLEEIEAERARAERAAAFEARLDVLMGGKDTSLTFAQTMQEVEETVRAFARAISDSNGWGGAPASTRTKAAFALMFVARGRRLGLEAPESEWGLLIDEAKRIDPDPLRDEIREIIRANDMEALAGIVADRRPEDLPKTTIHFVGVTLAFSRMRLIGMEWLRRGRDAYPGDWSLNMAFGSLTPGIEGVGALRAAVALRPESAATRAELGDKLMSLGSAFADAAMAEYQEALRIDPGFGFVHARIAQYHRGQGDATAAREASDEAIREMPLDASGYYERAVRCWTSDPARALAFLRKAHEFGEPAWVKVNLASLLAHAKDPAVRNAQEALQLADVAYEEMYDGGGFQPHTAHAALAVGGAHFRLGRFAEALQYLNEAQKTLSDHTSVSSLLGMTHWKLGDESEARRWLALAEELFEEKPDTSSDRGVLIEEARAMIGQ